MPRGTASVMSWDDVTMSPERCGRTNRHSDCASTGGHDGAGDSGEREREKAGCLGCHCHHGSHGSAENESLQDQLPFTIE